MVNSPRRRLGGIAFGLAVTASPLLGLPSVAAASADAADDRAVPFVLERANGEHDEKVYYGKGSVSFAKSAIQDRTWDESVGTTMAVTVPERGERGNIRAVDELIAGEAGRCLAVARYTMSWTTEACTPEHDFLRAADGSLQHIGTGEYLTASGSGSAALLYTSVREQDKATFVGDEARSEVPGRPGFPVAHVSGNKTTITWSAPQVGGKPDLYQIKLDDGAWQGAPGVEASFTFLDVPAGSHKVTLKAQNSSGTSRDWTTVFFVMETAVDAVDGEKRTARVSGTAPEGAEIEVDGVRVATADGAGAWSAEVAAPEGRAAADVRFDALVSGRLVTSRTVPIDFGGSEEEESFRPVVVDQAEVQAGARNTFTGTATPGATFRVLNPSGTQIVAGEHRVEDDGTWTFDRVVSTGADRLAFVIEQRLGDRTEVSKSFSLPASATRPTPVTVSTGSVVAGVSNTFEGTAEAGARFRVLNGSGTQIVPGEHTVAADGRWSFDRVVSKGASGLSFRLEVTGAGGFVSTSPVFTVPAGVPFSVERPGRDGVLDPGTGEIVLTGRGADGAEVEVRTPGKPAVRTTVAAGKWSVPVELVEGDNDLAVRYAPIGSAQPVEQTVPVRVTPYPTEIEVTSDTKFTPGEHAELSGTATPNSGFIAYDAGYPSAGTRSQVVRVDDQGRWTWTSVVASDRYVNSYRATFTLGEKGRQAIDLEADGFATELAVDAGQSYTPGKTAVLRGTGTPGGRFVAQLQYGQFTDRALVDITGDGSWEVATRRPVSEGTLSALLTGAEGVRVTAELLAEA